MSDSAFQQFTHSLAQVTEPQEAFAVLQTLTNERVGSRLFTIMCVDMQAMLASRAYTSDPHNYPGSGTKPVQMNSWFEVVHTQGRTFVANCLDDIAKVFPDHELIGSLGCESVVNLPIMVQGHLVATLNILHEADYYTPERVNRIEHELRLPSMAAWLLYDRLSRQ